MATASFWARVRSGRAFSDKHFGDVENDQLWNGRLCGCRPVARSSTNGGDGSKRARLWSCWESRSVPLHREWRLYPIGSLGKAAKVEAGSSKRYPGKPGSPGVNCRLSAGGRAELFGPAFFHNARSCFAIVTRKEKSVRAASQYPQTPVCVQPRPCAARV